MIVGFKHWRHDNSLEGSLIAAATGSDWIHSELFFSNGLSVSSWPGTRGVSYKDAQASVVYPQYWEFYDAGDFDEQPLVDFLAKQLGQGYDWKGILASRGLPVYEQNQSQWTCSGLVYYALVQYAPDSLPILNSEAVPTPGEVRQLMIEAGYERIEFPYVLPILIAIPSDTAPQGWFSQTESWVLLGGTLFLVLLLVVVLNRNR